MNLEDMYLGICGWWKDLDETTKQAALDDFALSFSLNSARIEKEHTSHEVARQIFDKDAVENYTGELKPLVQVFNQKRAWMRATQYLSEERPIDTSLVLDLHQTLCAATYSERNFADGERPGTFRLGDCIIPDSTEIGADPEEVPGLVDDLCDQVSDALGDATPKRVLTAASFFHASYETIHPFADGNGISGRLLMNYTLIMGGNPPAVIFATDRPAYYEALEAFNRQGDLKPFKSFVMAETIKTWRKLATELAENAQ